MNIAGYCLPKVDALGQSPIDMTEFRGLPCRCLEINHQTKSLLCINNKATGMASFDFDQIDKYFECRQFGNLLIPPGLSTVEAMEYHNRVFFDNDAEQRDMNFIRLMTIAISLSKGEFDDSLYFSTTEQ